ncbi:hypothetical protein Tco_0674979 [Tanacetum coccineum]
MFRKEFILIKSLKSSTQHSFVNDFVVLNIPEEDVEPKHIIFDPDDQPMWKNAKIVAPTLNSDIVQHNIDDNFVFNSTHLKMIWENKFDGQLRADPHDRIYKFLAIYNMFKYGETQNESIQEILDVSAGGIFLYKSPNQAFQFLEDKVLFNLDWSTKSQNKHHQKSVTFADGSDSNDDNYRLMEKLEALTIKMDSKFQSLREEMHEMRKNYNNCGGDHASKNDDTPMCERHEANYIQSEGYENRNYYDLFSHQSHYKQSQSKNDSEKSLTELNNDVRNDLEHFKRCICSMRTVHWKLFAIDDGKTTSVLPNKEYKTVNQEPQSKTDLEKSITKFLDGQRVTNMFFKNNVNDMILKMKQNEKNFQTKIKNMERKIVEWEKSQNISSKQTDRTDPPPPPTQTEQVNAVFTGSGKSNDSPKIQTLPPIIEKGKPIKTSKKDIMWLKQMNIHSLCLFCRLNKAGGAWIGGWHFTLGDLYNWSIILHVVEYTCLAFGFAPYPSEFNQELKKPGKYRFP